MEATTILSSSMRICHYRSVGVRSASHRLFLCKGSEACIHAKYRYSISRKISRQPSTDCIHSGYSVKFSMKFHGVGSCLASLWNCKEKDSSETKSMTTDN